MSIKHARHRHPAAHRYLKLVRWSDADGAFIGSCPPIIGDCCHGGTESEVMDQLVVIVDEWLAIHDADGTELPPATNTEFSGKLTLRINPSLHRALALRSTASGSSLNRYIENTLAQSLG